MLNKFKIGSKFRWLYDGDVATVKGFAERGYIVVEWKKAKHLSQFNPSLVTEGDEYEHIKQFKDYADKF